LKLAPRSTPLDEKSREAVEAAAVDVVDFVDVKSRFKTVVVAGSRS
jgi:hypothetical protein